MNSDEQVCPHCGYTSFYRRGKYNNLLEPGIIVGKTFIPDTGQAVEQNKVYADMGYVPDSFECMCITCWATWSNINDLIK